MARKSKAFYVRRARRGGLARAKVLTPKRQQEIARSGARALNRRLTKAQRTAAARKAVQARWARAQRGTSGSHRPTKGAPGPSSSSAG